MGDKVHIENIEEYIWDVSLYKIAFEIAVQIFLQKPISIGMKVIRDSEM